VNAANIQVTVEVIVNGDTPEVVQQKAKRLVEDTLTRAHGWACVVATNVVCERNDKW